MHTCSAQGGKEWFAAVRLFFGVRQEGTDTWVPHALVRWYEHTGQTLPGTDLQVLRWEDAGSPTSRLDVIPTATISRPVFLQRYPVLRDEGDDAADWGIEEAELDTDAERYVYNHFL